MIIFLYGPDSFRSKRKLDEIIEAHKKVSGSLVNVVYVDAEVMQFSEFFSQFNTNSMFAKKKLLIINNSFSDESFRAAFLENIKVVEEAKDIVVIYEGAKPDERTKFFKELQKTAKTQKFEFLNPLQLKKWIVAECKANNCDIDLAAAELLAEYVKNDMWRMNSEIQKLCNFKKGSTIKKEDVKLLVKPSIENYIFETIDALAGNNKKQAIALLKNHIESGDNPLYMLSMIAYQFRNFLVVKDLVEKKMPYYAIIKNSGLHPFVAQKTMQMVSRFSFEQLKHIYQKIFEMDEEMKTGKIDPEMALDMFLAEI